MSEADLVAAVFRALTGGRHDDGGGDLHAVLADEGWDAAALRSHARAVVAGGGVWPHPVLTTFACGWAVPGSWPRYRACSATSACSGWRPLRRRRAP